MVMLSVAFTVITGDNGGFLIVKASRSIGTSILKTALCKFYNITPDLDLC